MTCIPVVTPPAWPDYELIDSGNFYKLERFGAYTLARPEPQALWQPSLPEPEWQRQTHAYFRRDKQSPERGEWQTSPQMHDPWRVQFRQGGLQLTFKLALTSFKHVGLFPEQADNWLYIYQTVTAMHRRKPQPRVLNLFAYTGGASLAARQAGADVTHVDAVKPVVNWARENMDESSLSAIRWLVDDAVKFVRREVRRGRRYEGIILDPPAYGRGPDGEKWVLEDSLPDLLQDCRQLLDEAGFVIINLYSLGYSSLMLANLMEQVFGSKPQAEMGELVLQDRAQKWLPLGVFYRFRHL